MGSKKFYSIRIFLKGNKYSIFSKMKNKQVDSSCAYIAYSGWLIIRIWEEN